ncbi:DExH-box ATP-dependent RNA helicase DExH14, partial [Bienertia sinuspersici]
MVLQLPRLTNSLRQPFDIDRAYLHRKTILQSLYSQSNANSIDESELARKIVSDWEEASPEVRQTYKQFIGAVVDLIDGEVVSEEFREVALTAYRLFSDKEEDSRRIAEKKSELLKVLGHAVSDGSLQKVTQLAQRLCSLQPCNNTAIPKLNENFADNDVEFGFNLDFRPPSRFLLDVPLEDDQFLGLEDLAPSTSLYNNWSASDAVDNHFPNGGVKYDLKWLRDSCDLIVQGSGSQLTRDEVAMTICRVLDSEKPGEEIAGDLLDLVGDSAFDIVQELILHRKELVDLIRHGLLVLRSDKPSSNAQPRMPSYGTQVTVQTQYEKQIDKLRRKEEKRHKRGVEHGLEDEFSCTSFSNLLEASERKNLFDDVIGSGQGPQSLGISALPQGTVRKHFKGYEEVIIPPIPTAPMKPGEKL